MKAFRRLLEGDVPTGSAGLDKSEVMAYSADLYRLDGQMSYDRAKVMGGIIASLSPSQTNFLNTYMVGKGMLQWPAVTEPADMQGLDRPVKEALMTYAGDIYSWYTGSLEADVYFCPERQGTYFGSFYLKDTPVMSVGGSIDTNLTANAGITFVLTLTPTQKTLVTGLVDIQRTDLNEIVARRQDMSTAFRRFIAGQPVSLTEVLSQANRYGELDGEIVYNIATNFAALSRTLTTSQRATFNGLRQQILNGFPLTPEPNAYLYSDQIAMPTIPNTDFLFLPALTHKVYLPLVGVNIGAVITPTPSLTPTLPDTGQVTDYTATFGEDADYSINPPTYTVNGNGTVVRKQKCPRGHCDLKPMLRMSSRTPLKVRKQKCQGGHCDASAYSGLVVFVLGEKTKMPARALRQTVRYASATKLLRYPAENKNAGEAPGLCDSQRRLNAVRLDKVRQFWTTFWCVLLVPLVGENRLMFFATELDFLLVRERNPWRCGSLLAA